MANDARVTPALVREYFVKNGGKVKRHDLFDHFRAHLDKSDDQGSLKNQFGDLVNSLAFLQNIEGEKFFVLKKSKNGTTPVVLRRPPRLPNQRKEKGLSLPSSMRNFRFSAAEDTAGNFILADSKSRPNSLNRQRAGLRSDTSTENLLRRNNSDTSISENGLPRDSGVDTAVSSVQSESTSLGSRKGSLPRSIESDRLSLHSGDTGVYTDDDQYDIEIPSYTLDGFEKSWMMSTMTGNKSNVICHLEQEANIVLYKDFITGYTGLHWAAKQGNEDIVRILAKAGANVNAKSNGGYTPLHLAAMHGHTNIMNILIDEYHVDVHIRDYSGKKPKDVVKKNSPDQIKQKLKDPSAATDLSNVGLKSQEMSESQRVKPKLRTSSFRFLKKPKKYKRDRPVIEHWDSARQERLQSTLEIDEKELYKMQRTNTGSLFPTSFYFGNRPDQSLTASPQVDVLDNGDELHESTEDVVHKREAQRERLKSRSYPESEFRNITRIIEENSQELNDEHSYLPQSPSESLSSSSVTYVEPEQRLLDTVFSSLETGGSDRGLLVNDGNRRRSHSEENLSGIASSFRDELATRLTFDRNPAVKSQGSSTAQNKAKSLREDEKSLPLVGDSSSDMQYFGDELATLLTIPEKKSNAPSVKESKDSQSKPIHGMISAYDSERSNNLIVDDELQKPTLRTKSSKDSSDLVKRTEDIKPFLTYGDEYSTTLILPEQPQKQQSLTPSAAETAYNKDQGVLQLSNSYKNVSGLLDSETTRETKVRYIDEPRDFPTSTSDISPVRPPRKKDKISKKSGKAKEIHFQKNNHDFYAGNKQAASLSDRFSESDLREIHRFDREDTKPDWTRDRLKNDQNRRQSLPTYVEYRGEENGLDFAPHDRQEKTSHSVHDRDPQPGGESNERHMSEEVNERRSGDWSRANPEYSRRKIDGYAKSQEVFVPQDVSPGYRRERLSNNFSTGTDALRSENRNKHVLPEVLLDATVRTTSLDHHEERKSSSRSSWSESAPDRLRQELRVPPPYRPPPYALTDPGSRQPNDFVLSPENSSNKTRLASRLNYPPPSIPPTLRPDYPPPNIPPNLRPNYTPPSIPPPARRSQRPDDYKPAFETSLDHPKRRLIKYSPDSYEPTSIPDYQTRNASLDERRSSPRQRHGERPVHLDVSSPAEALPPSNKNREGKVGNYYYPVDNSPFDGRNRDTTTRKSLETGNYNTSYNVSSRNGPSGQSGLVQYEQEMATVLLPRREIRSEPGFVGSESSIRRGSDPGYVVAKHIPSNISCEVPAGHRGSKEDLNLISRYREEDTTSKSFPNSYDSQRTPELERRQKYRVTSMI